MEQDKMENKQEVRHLVRVVSNDLDCSKPLYHALTKIKGISTSLANIICNVANIEKTKKTGLLTDEEVSKLDSIIKNPLKFNIPVWALNRRKDPETDEDKHLIGPDMKFTQENDIKKLKKIKSYIGMRHSSGLPVRGQRTKSNFRRNKGKGSLGVKRKRAKAGRV